MHTKHSPGFGLIEVLITLFIFATGILALIQLQWASSRHNQQILLQATALNQISQLVEQTPIFSVLDSSVLQSWQQNTQQILPDGKAELSLVQHGYRFSVFWRGNGLVRPASPGSTDCCLLQRYRSK